MDGNKDDYRDPYPIVQDLTDAEYGCCACSSEMFGSFSIKDLAMPTTTPLSIPSPPRKQFKKSYPSSSSESPPQNPSPPQQQQHKRTHSLLLNEHHQPTNLHTNNILEFDERAKEYSNFSDNFVLTRQVSSFAPSPPYDDVVFLKQHVLYEEYL